MSRKYFQIYSPCALCKNVCTTRKTKVVLETMVSPPSPLEGRIISEQRTFRFEINEVENLRYRHSESGNEWRTFGL